MSRVLFVNPTTGGIGHYTHNLATALRSTGADVGLVTSAEEPYELADFVSPFRKRYDSIRAFPLPEGPSLRAKIGRRMIARSGPRRNNAAVADAAREFGADIIHYQWLLNEPEQAALWRDLKRRTGASIVYTAHDILPHEMTPDQMRSDTSGRRDAWIALMQTADQVIVHADRLKEQLAELYGVGGDRVSVVPHGNYTFLADDPNRRWSREAARVSLGLGENDVAVLFFGFIREYKGLETLVEAVAGLDPSARLLVVGRPYPWPTWEETPYAALAERVGVAPRLIPVTEYVPLIDVARYFSAADVVALPYHRASQSGVLQMAYGFARASVCTDTGGLREASVPGETALFVPPRDPAALAAALGDLIRDPIRRERVGAAGRHFADTAFSWEPIARRTAEIYARLTR